MDDVYERFIEICTKAETDDPVQLFSSMAHDEAVKVHGPWHHVIVPMALITAYWNVKRDFDLESYLREAISRGCDVPVMICGLWGCCGSAVGTGIFMSVITRTGPISRGKRWGQCNKITSDSLMSISEMGGPRCCKRNAITSIRAACEFVRLELGVELHPSKFVCTYDKENNECIGQRCPYYNNKKK